MDPHRDDELKGSSARLWSLVAERARPGADVASIDRRIWDLFGEDWAILFTDLAGFSRNVAEFGILHFLEVIHQQRRSLLPVVAAHDGLLIKSDADSFLVLFRRPDRAVDCALAMQAECERINQERAPERKVLLCAGIGYGRILRVGDDDVWGREVNAASKLGEDTARAGEVLVTEAVRAAIGERADCALEPIESPLVAGSGAYRVRRV
ncbi:MAG: adenylate/guanylate cyclase domain-containing protein [Polyangiaceae bacterium]|nr:adenylate/guanylate cyclase domain-containing protein [Polyangiaceae bacterium]